MDSLLLWGKYTNKDHGAYPALYHMMDVALVAQALLKRLSESEQRALLAPFSLNENPTNVMAFFIALHDLGKLTPGFQNILPDLIKPLEERGLWRNIDDPRLQGHMRNHGDTGYGLLCSELKEKFPEAERYEQLSGIANAVAAHHGAFFYNEYAGDYEKEEDNSDGNQGVWGSLRTEGVNWLLEQMGLDWASIQLNDHAVSPAWVMHFAGFCSVADWMGSDMRYFPYVKANEYVKADRKANADKMLDLVKIKNGGLSFGQSKFDELFEFSINATQQACIEIFDSNESPVLTIIETPMGSGKTEAALVLMNKYIREKNKVGSYFALPTQATGNQIFERVMKFFEKHPAIDSEVELHLMHGNAAMNEKYAELQASSINDDEQGTVAANEWFTQKKRGLLAGHAVGTVDQCLLAILQTKHFFVRLFGLADKVLVIDEVHAYDTYTSKLLDSLLAWMAVLNTPVILLSATLPDKRRCELIDAYYQQLPCAKIDNAILERQGQAQEYPRVSCLDASGCYQEKHISQQDSTLPKSYGFRLVVGDLSKRWQQTSSILKDRLSDGGCAACIVNTVQDAQCLFSHLQKDFNDDSCELILFHARFPLFQRLEIEDLIREKFGKQEQDGPSKRPSKAIVVATQVLEQSLDVDFDVMVSALAPIDLLLQRIGRVHRHRSNQHHRPHKLSDPVLYCLSPALESLNEDAEEVFGYAEANIYAPSRLFHTQTSLQQRSIADDEDQYPLAIIRSPEDFSILIEQVYQNPLPMDDAVQGSIVESWNEKMGVVGDVKVNVAKKLILPDAREVLCNFMGGLADGFDEDDPKMTRLASPSIGLVLVKQNDKGQWCLLENNQPIDIIFAPPKEQYQMVVRSSVKISNASWVAYFKDAYTQNKSRFAWHKKAALKGLYPLCLSGDDKFVASKPNEALIYIEELGLVIQR